ADPVSHQLGIESGLGQALTQVLAGFRLVFDDQQFHGRLGRGWYLEGRRRYTVRSGDERQADKVVICLSGRCQSWVVRVSHRLNLLLLEYDHVFAHLPENSRLSAGIEYASLGDTGAHLRLR